MLNNINIYSFAKTILAEENGVTLKVYIDNEGEPRVTSAANPDGDVVLKGDALDLSFRTDVFKTKFTRSKSISLEGLLREEVQSIAEDNWYRDHQYDE